MGILDSNMVTLCPKQHWNPRVVGGGLSVLNEILHDPTFTKAL